MNVLGRPERFFLVMGLVVGVLGCVLVPSFAGIDEPEHFARAYQLSTGTVLPQPPPPGVDGVGACLPRGIANEVASERAYYWYATRPSPEALDGLPTCDSGGAAGSGHFIEFATFSWYSPLGYIPQTFGVGIGRLVSGDATVMLLLGRLAVLAAYVGIVYAAIRRTPTGRWAMAVVGLLPVALLQAATSLAPDALATALTMLVLATALRACDKSIPVKRTRYLIEACVFGLGLGLTKPTYVIVCLAYFLPLLRRDRVAGPAAVDAAVPALSSLGVSFAWHRWRQPDFVCDVRHFQIDAQPGAQTRAIITGPHHFLVGVARGLRDNAGYWITRLVVPGEQVMPEYLVPSVLLLTVTVLAVFAVVGAQRCDTETLFLSVTERVALLVVFAFGVLVLFAGWFVYCSPEGFELTSVPHIRLFVPFLVLPAVALAPAGPRSQRLARTKVPVAVTVVATWIILIYFLARRVH